MEQIYGKRKKQEGKYKMISSERNNRTQNRQKTEMKLVGVERNMSF